MSNASLTSVIAGVNSIGLFASRAFVSAFAIAAVLKWGPQWPWLHNTGLLQSVQNVPSWFTHDITVTILGLLAALEIAATKSADARQILNEVDSTIKSATAFLTTLTVSGIITANDADIIREITAWQEPVRAGLGDTAVSVFVAAISAAGVWLACQGRRALLGNLMEADPGDDTMIAGLFSWLEDIWAFVGTLLLILFPLVMLAITAVLLSGITYFQWRAKRKEQLSKVPCTSCGEPMFQCAVACANCDTANPDVHAVGWLGQTRQRPADDIALHPIALTQKQRCPACATHLKPRRVRQSCPACGHELFKDQGQTDAYLAVLDKRLPLVLIVTGALSLIPIVGLIPAIMVYRMRLITPVRRYTSMVTTIPARWLLRVLFLILIWVQVIPGIGAFAVPLMATISYGTYRRLFRKQREREIARKPIEKSNPQEI